MILNMAYTRTSTKNFVQSSYLLNHPTTIHLESQCKYMSKKFTSQLSSLRCHSMFKKLKLVYEPINSKSLGLIISVTEERTRDLGYLLIYIISDHIRHQSKNLRENFLKNHVLFCCCSLKFLLNESASIC